jgi:hypothetical protein
MMLADGRGIDNLKRELLEFLEDDVSVIFLIFHS